MRYNDLPTAMCDRYARALMLPEVGGRGQFEILASRVLIVGAGALGCAVGTYLASAGVGRIGIMDFDLVETQNLVHHTLFTHRDVGKAKAEVAAKKLAFLNRDVDVWPLHARITADNCGELVTGWEIIVDCSDNLATHYLLGDVIWMRRLQLVYGSVSQSRGHAATFDRRNREDDSACYRCLFPEPPPADAAVSNSVAGMFAPACGVIGSVLAGEVLKLCGGFGEPLIAKMFLYDGMEQEARQIHAPRDPDCALCGSNRTVKDILLDYDQFCGVTI